MQLATQQLAAQLRHVATLIEAAGPLIQAAGKLESPPAVATSTQAPPPAKPKASKPAAVKRGGGRKAEKGERLREFFRANPNATTEAGAAFVGCSQSLAAAARRSLKPAVPREGESASPPAAEESGGDDSEDEPAGLAPLPPTRGHYWGEGSINLPTAKAEPSTAPPDDEGSDAQLLAAVLAIASPDRTITQVAVELGAPVERVKTLVHQHSLPHSTNRQGKRGTKFLNHWVWDSPAELVDIIAPEIGEPLVAQLYERAAMVRRWMKPFRRAKANCYPIHPVECEPFSPPDHGIELRLKERFE
jgi:hypothetical protein